MTLIQLAKLGGFISVRPGVTQLTNRDKNVELGVSSLQLLVN